MSEQEKAAPVGEAPAPDPAPVAQDQKPDPGNGADGEGYPAHFVDKLKDEKRAAKAKASELRDKLDAAEKQIAELATFRDSSAELRTQLETAQADLATRDAKISRLSFEGEVLRDVAPAKRAEAELVLEGLLARGEYKPSAAEDEKKLAATAREQIAERFPHFYQSGSSRLSPQGESVAKSSIPAGAKSLNEIPADQWGHLTPADFARLAMNAR